MGGKMNPQDFKALLDALNRIGDALDGKRDIQHTVKVVNRLSFVFRRLKHASSKHWSYEELLDYIKETRKIYAKIIGEVLNENS